ncbi:NACHT C-terminal alpha/beta 1 domain-containing protein [Nostoc spongiaeforme]|nr:NACHT domain-containing protein [Nostoc spongiaeforme]
MGKPSYLRGREDAKILLNALLSFVDDVEESKDIKADWQDDHQLWVRHSTLEGLAELTNSLDVEAIRNALNCLIALGILEDKREATNSRTRTNSKVWRFAVKFPSIDKETNLNCLFRSGGEWDKRREAKKSKPRKVSNPSAAKSHSIDWREVCIAMLKSQQEAARLRRKATEQGFEINVYVPLGLVERQQQQRRQLNEQPDRANVYELTQEVIVKTYEHDAFLQEVIAQQSSGNNKHIAVIGEPGAGKTTLLSTIASFIQNNTQDLPICISLANLQGRTIEEYLLKQWLTDAMKLVKSDVVVTPEIERQLIECFAKERVWLLLDGVDEMGENSPVQALTKINRELTASLRQARVVLTCRLNVWDAQVNNTLTGFNTYKTQEFKPEQIDDFIQQWFERAGDLAKGKTLQDKLKATQHENIRKLVTNPLRLSLLCQTFYLDKQGELPETKAALYQRFTFYFYEWKSELSPELCNSDDLKDELHQALSKLAFAGINSPARFRLRRSLARQEMREELFKLACDVGWLNLVDRVAETDEEVYAFFHPNFQEYFAALKVDDWHEFLNHVPANPTQGTYRIFKPQWKEVILLWFGREDVKNEEKEAFIQILVEFDDKFQNLYWYQAYFLAAVGIKEFNNCRHSAEIVQQVVKWTFGYFDTAKQVWLSFIPLNTKACILLKETIHKQVIIALTELLHFLQDEQIRRKISEKNGTSYDKIKIAEVSLTLLDFCPENSKANEALKELIHNSDDFFVPPFWLRNIEFNAQVEVVRRHVFLNSLHNHQPSEIRKKEISYRPEEIIDLIDLINRTEDSNPKQYEYRLRLEEIVTRNPQAIPPVVEVIKRSLSSNLENDYYPLFKAIECLVKIGSCSSEGISILMDVVSSKSNYGNYAIKEKAIGALGIVGVGNKDVFKFLLNLLHNENMQGLRWNSLGSLGSILSGDMFSLAVSHLRGYLEDSVYHNYRALYVECYLILWHCAQNIAYPDFYQAWHQGNSKEISLNHLELPQRLQAAIKNDPQLSQNIHLICIDTSKFIESDNPAAEIYAEMVNQGCPERASGEANNMSGLKVYFKLLKTDKRVVLVFHPGATNPTGEATYSHAFLNAISKFEGAVCLISDLIPNYSTLKVFTSHQSVDEILEWLRCC